MYMEIENKFRWLQIMKE